MNLKSVNITRDKLPRAFSQKKSQYQMWNRCNLQKVGSLFGCVNILTTFFLPHFAQHRGRWRSIASGKKSIPHRTVQRKKLRLLRHVVGNAYCNSQPTIRFQISLLNPLEHTTGFSLLANWNTKKKKIAKTTAATTVQRITSCKLIRNFFQ